MPFIVRYEVDGRRYFYITGWSHQRIDKPSRARYPLPPEGARTREDDVDEAETRESVASPPEKTPAVTGEQGNRGTGKRHRRGGGAYTHEFEQWWTIYPTRSGSKGSKYSASNAWLKSTKFVSVDALLAATKRYADSQRVRDGFAKDAATWLNQRCWEEFTANDAPGLSPADWLKGEWKLGRVRYVIERTGLHYPQPNLPIDLPPDRTESWQRDRGREWIAEHHDLIIERLAGRESA